MNRPFTITVAAAILAPTIATAQSPEPVVEVKSVVRRVEQQTQVQRERARQQQDRLKQQERARAQREEQERRRFPDEQTEKISRTLNIGNDGQLELSNLAGDIVITRGGGNVQIEAVKIARGRTAQDAKEALGEVDVRFDERGARAEVRTLYPRGERRTRGSQNSHVSVRFTVSAPENTKISVNSLSGNIRVSDIRGDLNLTTLSGDVVVHNAARVLGAQSTSGDVEITNLRSEIGLEANAVSGSVTVRDSNAPRMDIGSVSGNLTIADVRSGRIEATTTSGDIEFGSPLEKNGRYELSSHSGVIRVFPIGSVGFDLEADSFSGNIESALTLTNVRQGGADYGRRTPRGRTRSLEGTYGDGSATLEITTFSGTVIIGKK